MASFFEKFILVKDIVSFLNRLCAASETRAFTQVLVRSNQRELLTNSFWLFEVLILANPPPTPPPPPNTHTYTHTRCIWFHILNMFTHFYSEQLQFHGQLTMCYNLGAYISFHILNVFTHFYPEQLQFHGQLTMCYNLRAYTLNRSYKWPPTYFLRLFRK